MAVTLRWQIPANDGNYDFVYVYKSTSETGTYSQLTYQAIDKTDYCDVNGGINNWYKVRFFNSVANAWSDYSDAMQGGTYAGYSSVDEVREISNLTSDDITDGDLYNLIKKATAYLNAEINQRILREQILPIDEVRTNNIDGTNATFYIKKWQYHLADMSNDGKVTKEDLIVYQRDSNNVETIIPVASVDADIGQFTLATAPSGGVRLYVTYEWTYVSEYQPHALVKLACEYLATAFAFEKVERGLSPQQVYGNVRIYRDMAASSEWHKRYREVVTQINSEMFEWKQAPITF